MLVRFPPDRFRTKSVAMLLSEGLFAFGVAGCGESADSDSGDEVTELSSSGLQEIEKVSTRLVLSTRSGDGEAICFVFEPDFVDTTFGSKAKCVAKFDRPPQKGAGLGNLTIEKVEATERGVIVTYDKNPPGEIPMLKQGKRWYVDLAGDPPQQPDS